MTSPGLQAKHFWSLLMESVLISYSMFIPGCSSSLFCSRSSGDLKERSQQYWRGILKIVSKRGRPTSCHKWVTPVAWNLAWLDCTGCTICWTIFDYMPPTTTWPLVVPHSDMDLQTKHFGHDDPEILQVWAVGQLDGCGRCCEPAVKTDAAIHNLSRPHVNKTICRAFVCSVYFTCALHGQLAGL